MPENKKAKGGGLIALFFKFSIGSWFSAALSFFTTPIVTALILPEEFGKASMFSLAYGFALQIVMLGADQSFVRFFYQKEYEHRRSSVLQSCLMPAFAISAVLAAVCLLFWRPISHLLIDRQDFRICALLATTIFVGVLERYAVLVVRMFKKAVFFSVLRIIGSVATFLVIVIYCHFVERSLYAILYSTLIPLLITTITAVAYERGLWFKSLSIDKTVIRAIVRYGLPFVPTFLASWLFEGIDRMALRTYSTFTEIGLFTAAMKIVALLSILQISFSTFWAPVAYEAYEKQTEEAQTMFRRTFSFLALALFSGGLMITAFKDVIMLFFAHSYDGADLIMPFLLLIPIMYTLSEVTVGGINFRNQTHWHLVIMVIAAVVNISLNFFMVPLLGAKGAAISTGVSYILFFYLRTYFSVRLFPINFGMRRITIALVLFAANAWVHSFWKTQWWNLSVTGIALLLMIALFRHELQLLYNSARARFKPRFT